MNDEEYESEKIRVRTITERWIRALGLNVTWRVTMLWSREEGGDGRTTLGVTAPGSVAAVCDADWRYREANITFHLPTIRRLIESPEHLESTVVHELIHVYLVEMREKGLDHEERVATELAAAFIWLRNVTREGEFDAKDEDGDARPPEVPEAIRGEGDEHLLRERELRSSQGTGDSQAAHTEETLIDAPPGVIVQ